MGCSSGPSISIVGDEHFFLVENGKQIEAVNISIDLGTGSYLFRPGASRLVRVCGTPGDAAEPCWNPSDNSHREEWINRVVALPPSRFTRSVIFNASALNGKLQGSVPAKLISATPFVIAYASNKVNAAAPPAPPSNPATPGLPVQSDRFGYPSGGQARQTGLIVAGDLDAEVDEVLVYPDDLAVATESGMNRSPEGLTVTHATLSRPVPLRDVLEAFTRGGLEELPVGASEELPATHPLYPRSMPPGWQKQSGDRKGGRRKFPASAGDKQRCLLFLPFWWIEQELRDNQQNFNAPSYA